MIAKHFTPFLPKKSTTLPNFEAEDHLPPHAVWLNMSARVGSTSDNRLGGWYSYRASKAALNMLVRTAAIELSRTRPLSLCVALHPGTVDTALSKPFQRGVPASRLFSPDHAARHLVQVIDALPVSPSGRCFAWDGQVIEP